MGLRNQKLRFPKPSVLTASSRREATGTNASTAKGSSSTSSMLNAFSAKSRNPLSTEGGVAMRYAPLTFTCQGCGRKTKSTSINVTSGYELMLTWKCKRCGKQVKAFLPLERIVTLAPSMQEPDYDKTDMDFLKEMNISLPPPP